MLGAVIAISEGELLRLLTRNSSGFLAYLREYLWRRFPKPCVRVLLTSRSVTPLN